MCGGGREVDRGRKGTVNEKKKEPGWVIKIFLWHEVRRENIGEGWYLQGNSRRGQRAD